MGSEESLKLLERLGLLPVKCRHCQQLWLAPGMAKDDEYACKECGGHTFNGKSDVSPRPRAARPC